MPKSTAIPSFFLCLLGAPLVNTEGPQNVCYSIDSSQSNLLTLVACSGQFLNVDCGKVFGKIRINKLTTNSESGCTFVEEGKDSIVFEECECKPKKICNGEPSKRTFSEVCDAMARSAATTVTPSSVTLANHEGAKGRGIPGTATEDPSTSDNSVLTSFSKTSVLFVSVSFIILMVISLAWLVFYYVQRFRFAHAKDRMHRRLFNAAKKTLTKIPAKSLRSGDKELDCDCPVCIEPYRTGDVIRILPCKHIFHKSCVDPWLLEHRTCPMCKMDILKAYGITFAKGEDSGSGHNIDGDHISVGDHSSLGVADRSPSGGAQASPIPLESDVQDPFFPDPAPSPSRLQPVLHSSNVKSFGTIIQGKHGSGPIGRGSDSSESSGDSFSLQRSSISAQIHLPQDKYTPLHLRGSPSVDPVGGTPLSTPFSRASSTLSCNIPPTPNGGQGPPGPRRQSTGISGNGRDIYTRKDSILTADTQVTESLECSLSLGQSRNGRVPENWPPSSRSFPAPGRGGSGGGALGVAGQAQSLDRLSEGTGAPGIPLHPLAVKHSESYGSFPPGFSEGAAELQRPASVGLKSPGGPPGPPGVPLVRQVCVSGNPNGSYVSTISKGHPNSAGVTRRGSLVTKNSNSECV